MESKILLRFLQYTLEKVFTQSHANVSVDGECDSDRYRIKLPHLRGQGIVKSPEAAHFFVWHEQEMENIDESWPCKVRPRWNWG